MDVLKVDMMVFEMAESLVEETLAFLSAYLMAENLVFSRAYRMVAMMDSQMVDWLAVKMAWKLMAES